MYSNQSMHVRLPGFCNREISYTISWVLGDLFGLDLTYDYHEQESSHLVIKAPDTSGALLVSTSIFRLLNDNWLDAVSISRLVVKEYTLPKYLVTSDKKTCLPMLIDRNDQSSMLDRFINRSANEVTVNIDLLGALFFMISRYEECVDVERDQHDRYPARVSLTGEQTLQQQAIGNHYIELLWRCLKLLWPRLSRKKRIFSMRPSHDIDHPSFFWSKSHGKVIRSSLGDVVHDQNIALSAKKIINWIRCSHGLSYVDPYDQCNWLMAQSEKQGLRSAFYFIPFKTHDYDPSPPIVEPTVVDQWRRIAARGHEIGCHPGYETYLSSEALAQCFSMTVDQLGELGINQQELGGRQHVLRWSSKHTPRFLDSAGFDYDSTLGYAELSGFRCGVCYEYPMYDVLQRRVLKLVQRPLIAMDVTLLNQRYMHLSHSEAYDLLVHLKNECRKYQGSFTLLWHNTELLTDARKELYCSILAA